MRILDVCAFYSPYGGGVKTYVRRKMELSAQLGHEIVILAPGEREEIVEERDGAILATIPAPLLPAPPEPLEPPDPLAPVEPPTLLEPPALPDAPDPVEPPMLPEPAEPELMYKMVDKILIDEQELSTWAEHLSWAKTG